MTIPSMEIDATKAVELLEAAVATRGADYRYPDKNCSYFATHGDVTRGFAPHVGAPMCIVGQVLSSLGLNADDIPHYNRASASSLLEVLEADGLRATSGARTVFELAQDSQDVGNTWGEALDGAKAAAR